MSPRLRTIPVLSLEPSAFAPFGTVHAAPPGPGRRWDDAALGWQGGLAPSLSLLHLEPTPPEALVVRTLERHPRTSQTFLPLEVGRWLLVVAPDAAAGGPDPERARAFLAGPGVAVTYALATWHLAMTVLDRPATMAILMGRDGTAADDEIVPVPPFALRLPP